MGVRVVYFGYSRERWAALHVLAEGRDGVTIERPAIDGIAVISEDALFLMWVAQQCGPTVAEDMLPGISPMQLGE